jgi:hypothetical protein
VIARLAFLGLLLSAAPAFAVEGAMCLSKAVTTDSTKVLPAAPGLAAIRLMNAGPDVEFCGFGAVRYLMGIGSDRLFRNPPAADLSCASFNGGGNTVAHTQVCVWR